MTAGAPLGEEISWGPSHLLLQFLAMPSNLTTIQLGPNYPFKNYSLIVLPVGPVPMLITKNCCYVSPSPLVLFSAPFGEMR